MKRKCRRAVIVVRRHSFCGHFPLRKNLPSIHHHHGAGWALTNRQAAVPIFGQLLLPIISSFASHAVLPLFRVVEEHTTLKSRWGWLGAYPHIRPRGGEKKAIELHGFRPKRWIVEVAHSWFNRFRKIHVRYEKTACAYNALLYLAAMMITMNKIMAIYPPL